MVIHTSLSYIPCDTSSKEQTGYIIMFTQFEEGGLLYETSEDAEINDKSVKNPMMIQLFHHYLPKKKFMRWILAMIQMMILYLWRC